MSEIITIENLSAKNLPELKGWKSKQNKLVKDNPFIEITDHKSYEIGKKHRTALLKGRTGLSNQYNLIASKLKEFRNQVSDETVKLINITIDAEKKQQEEVKKYEAVIEEKRAKKQRLDDDRVKKISDRIKEIYNEWYQTIRGATYSTMKNIHNDFEHFVSGLDREEFGEFDILLEDRFDSLNEHLSEYWERLEKTEAQRIEDLRLKKEREDIEKEKQKQRKILDKEIEKRRKAQEKIDAENKKKQEALDKRKVDLDFEKERLERIEIDRLAREQKEKQVKAEKKKLADAKKIATALKPDLEKLEEIINSIEITVFPILKTVKAEEFYVGIEVRITELKLNLTDWINGL